ncbi:MAG: hypothetical protein Q8N96_07770 [Methylovulum sp.]|nr:hypothetical protein [Methylovulum sp.]
MNLKNRLIQLESRCVGLIPLYIFKLDGELLEQQQAQIDKAEAEGREVKVI